MSRGPTDSFTWPCPWQGIFRARDEFLRRRESLTETNGDPRREACVALENEKVVIHKKGFPSAEVRGNFIVGPPDLSPGWRGSGPGESRMPRDLSGSPRGRPA